MSLLDVAKMALGDGDRKQRILRRHVDCDVSDPQFSSSNRQRGIALGGIVLE